MRPLLTADGAEISYHRTGEGPAVLFIQGVAVIGAGWRPQSEALAGDFSVITFDNRGIGASTLGKRSALTIDAMADDALAIVEREHIRDFHVVGHSMGGLIAQAVALRAPSRVRSLTLMCTFVRGAEGARMTLAMAATALRMRIGSKAMRRNAFLELIMPAHYLTTRDREALARELTPLFGYDLANQPWFAMRQVRAMAKYDASARWRELADIPTLVVTGTHDRIALPAYGRNLATLINGARYVEFSQSGHGLPIQCAAEVTTLLAQHLSAAHGHAARHVALST